MIKHRWTVETRAAANCISPAFCRALGPPSKTPTKAYVLDVKTRLAALECLRECLPPVDRYLDTEVGECSFALCVQRRWQFVSVEQSCRGFFPMGTCLEAPQMHLMILCRFAPKDPFPWCCLRALKKTLSPYSRFPQLNTNENEREPSWMTLIESRLNGQLLRSRWDVKGGGGGREGREVWEGARCP